jgi:septal ring factor EnvC (AmiA/AmiB activator)
VTVNEILAWSFAGVFLLIAALCLVLFLLNERALHRQQDRAAQLRADIRSLNRTVADQWADLAERARDLHGVRKQLRESQDRGMVLAESLHQARARLWQLEQAGAADQWTQVEPVDDDTTRVFDDLMRTAFIADEEPSS